MDEGYFRGGVPRGSPDATPVGVHPVVGEAQGIGEVPSGDRLRPADDQADGEPAGLQPHVARGAHPFDVVDRGDLVRLRQQGDEALMPDARDEICPRAFRFIAAATGGMSRSAAL